MKIFVGNLTEGSATYIKGIKDEQERERLIKEDNGLADRFLFSCDDNTILITPWKINQDFKSDTERILNLKNIINLAPINNTVALSKDIEDDKELFKKLAALIKEANARGETVSIFAYCNTLEFRSLILELKERNCQFETPEMPEREFYWTVAFLDSKGGFRQVVQMISGWKKEVKMPWGIICARPAEARKIGRILFKQGKGFVVKTNWGQAGEGLMIIRRNNGFAEYEDASKFLKAQFEKEDYWEKYPIIIEEFIPPDLKIGGGAPNVECFIDKNGRPQVLYTCGMRMTREGVFKGVEIGKDALPSAIDKKIRQVGKVVGENFSEFGLRGFYEVDLQAGLDGELYCLEANIRRTGGTHVFEAARRMFGADFWKNKYFVSNNFYVHEALKSMSYEKLKEVLAEILYPINKKPAGLIPTIVNVLPLSAIGYIVLGDSKKDTEKIEEKFKEILDRYAGKK